MKLKSINKEQGVYVFYEGNGYSCMGFDYLKEKANKLADEMDRPELKIKRTGTKVALTKYNKLIEIARKKNIETGWRSNSCLIPQLIGMEGKRIEVIDCYDEKRRFYVGKSTGWIPCHLEIARIDSSGGCAVTGAPFKSIKLIEGKER